MPSSPLVKEELPKNPKEKEMEKAKVKMTPFEKASTIGDLCCLENLLCDEKVEDE